MVSFTTASAYTWFKQADTDNDLNISADELSAQQNQTVAQAFAIQADQQGPYSYERSTLTYAEYIRALQYLSGTVVSADSMWLEAIQNELKQPEYAGTAYKNAPENIRGNSTVFNMVLQKAPRVAMCYATQDIRNNKALVKTAVQLDPKCVQYASENLRDDAEIMEAALFNHGDDAETIITYASDRLRANKDFIRSIRVLYQKSNTYFRNMFENLAYTLRDDKEFVSEMLKSCPEIFRAVSARLRDDADVFKLGGYQLRYASARLQGDPAAVLSAIQADGSNLEYASETLRNVPALVLAAKSLEYASDQLKNDKKFVLAALAAGINCLCNVSWYLREDRDVVAASVQQFPASLRYAGQFLRDDRDIVLLTLQNPLVLEYASERLCRDKTFILMVIAKTKRTYIFPYIGEQLRTDPDILDALAAIGSDTLVDCYRQKQWQDDRAAIQADPSLFRVASAQLRNDPEFVGSLLGKVDWAYIGESLKNDKNFMLKAIQVSSDYVQYASEELQNDPEITLSLKYAFYLNYYNLGDKLLRDHAFFTTEVTKDVNFFAYAHDDLRDDKEYVLKLLKIHPAVYSYISERLRRDPDLLSFANNTASAVLRDNYQYATAYPDIASEHLLQDKAFVLPLVQQGKLRLSSVGETLLDDADIILAAVKDNTFYYDPLPYASERLRDSAQFIAAVSVLRKDALRYASDRLRNDSAFVADLVAQYPEAFQYAGEKLRNMTVFVRDLVTKQPQLLAYANERLRNDRDLVLFCIANNPDQNGWVCLRDATVAVQNDKDVAVAAITKNISALDYVGDSLRTDWAFALEILKLDPAKISWTAPMIRTAPGMTAVQFMLNKVFVSDQKKEALAELIAADPKLEALPGFMALILGPDVDYSFWAYRQDKFNTTILKLFKGYIKNPGLFQEFVRKVQSTAYRTFKKNTDAIYAGQAVLLDNNKLLQLLVSAQMQLSPEDLQRLLPQLTTPALFGEVPDFGTTSENYTQLLQTTNPARTAWLAASDLPLGFCLKLESLYPELTARLIKQNLQLPAAQVLLLVDNNRNSFFDEAFLLKMFDRYPDKYATIISAVSAHYGVFAQLVSTADELNAVQNLYATFPLDTLSFLARQCTDQGISAEAFGNILHAPADAQKFILGFLQARTVVPGQMQALVYSLIMAVRKNPELATLDPQTEVRQFDGLFTRWQETKAVVDGAALPVSAAFLALQTLYALCNRPTDPVTPALDRRTVDQLTYCCQVLAARWAEVSPQEYAALLKALSTFLDTIPGQNETVSKALYFTMMQYIELAFKIDPGLNTADGLVDTLKNQVQWFYAQSINSENQAILEKVLTKISVRPNPCTIMSLAEPTGRFCKTTGY
jgi:hypothetical protein